MQNTRTRIQIEGQQGISLITNEERQAFIDVIGENDYVLEIGTFQGATIGAVAAQRPKATFLSVDNYGWTEVFTPEQNMAAWWANRRPNMHMFIGTSHDLAAVCQSAEFNVIFIDGNHDYESCKTDLEVAETLTTCGGIICGHDYGTDNPGLAGVTKAVDEFCAVRGSKIDTIVGSVFIIKM